ncbi:MAG: hypothetical protein V1491_02250 [archaeon]
MKSKKMNSENVLLIVAVVAVIVAVAGLYITYDSINLVRQKVTGFAVEEGQVNITIQSQAAINITYAAGSPGSKIDFGSGYVTSGESYAILATNNTMTGGTGWNSVNGGFIVENIGNVNVTVGIMSSHNADDFLGGSVPLYQYNVSTTDAGSCNYTVGYSGNSYKNMTASDVKICDVFQNGGTIDEMRIDILLKVPSDSRTGALTETVTLTYETV